MGEITLKNEDGFWKNKNDILKEVRKVEKERDELLKTLEYNRKWMNTLLDSKGFILLNNKRVIKELRTMFPENRTE